MSANEIADFLKSTPLFGDVPLDKLRQSAELFRELRASSGEVVIHEGEIGDEMYLLWEGKVRVTRTLTLLTGRGFTDREKAFNILEAGRQSYFGEVALIGETPRTASVTAEQDCRLLVLSKDAFEKFCREDPAVGYQVLHRICENLCQLLDKSNRDVLKLATALSLALNR